MQHGSIKLNGVAGHEALAGSAPSDRELQPLGESRFRQMVELYLQNWETILGGPPGVVPPALETSELFLRRLQEVRTKPLCRRDIFEQTSR